MLLPKDGKIEVASRRRAQYLVGRDTDREIEALTERFDTQLAGQQALVARWSWLSPALVASESLTALAGSGSERYLEFRRQVGRFHGEWKNFFEPRLLEGRAIGPDDLRAMPRFAWVEPPRAGLHAGLALAALQLLLPVGALLGWAAWRLRRLRVV